MRTERTKDFLEDSPVATAILNYFDQNDAKPIKEICKDLREKLKNFKESYDDWPETPKAFAIELRRITPALNDTGIIVEFLKQGKKGVPVSIKEVSIVFKTNQKAA